MSIRNTLKKAFMVSVPVMSGYIVLGIGFGMVLKAKGYGIIWALMMSLFIYAGSMQFVAVNLLASGASFLTTALTTLLVNARHLFYGISMVEKYRGTGWKKPYLIFALTDETYSLVCQENGNVEKGEQHLYYFLLSFFNQCYWVTGSVIGAGLGSVLHFDSKGIDFALTALFITIVVDQWEKNRHHFPAFVGLISSVACLLVFGSEQFLIPDMIVIATILLAVRKREEVYYE